ncbi:MAG: 50S ribosomal protein L21 [Candidatus Omnitrophota bacterium]
MYAIIQTGGKQEKVNVGDVLTVERLPKKKDVSFAHVLALCDGDKIEIGHPFVKGAKVNAQILGEVRGEKSVSFKYRRRKSSRRTRGHRQTLTKVKITEIAS